MRRILITVFTSLFALAVIAPAAAQGASKYRYFEDLDVSGPGDHHISFAVLYKDKKGNRKFTARAVHAYDMRVVTGPPARGCGELDFGGNRYSKYQNFAARLDTLGRFAHRFENQAETPESSRIRGDLGGRVVKPLKRNNKVQRPSQVRGVFDVEDWDPNPGVTENCSSGGTFAAGPCKRWRSKGDRPRWWREWKAPVCSHDPW